MSSRRPSPDERPDGPVSGLFWDVGRQLSSVGNHESAEGHDAHPYAVVRGYDRALHPWLHGRRPSDLAQRFREVFGL